MQYRHKIRDYTLSIVFIDVKLKFFKHSHNTFAAVKSLRSHPLVH